MFSRKKVREMEAKIAELTADLDSRKAAEAKAAEKAARALPTSATGLSANQEFTHKGKRRLLIQLPSRAVSNSKTVEQWALVDRTDGKLTRMGIVESKADVLEYLSRNFYKRPKTV